MVTLILKGVSGRPSQVVGIRMPPTHQGTERVLYLKPRYLGIWTLAPSGHLCLICIGLSTGCQADSRLRVWRSSGLRASGSPERMWVVFELGAPILGPQQKVRHLFKTDLQRDPKLENYPKDVLRFPIKSTP